jgi:hypothetical protein
LRIDRLCRDYTGADLEAAKAMVQNAIRAATEESSHG